MAKLISKCPSCGEALYVSSLCCHDCGMELKSNFELSTFDKLDPELMSFLQCFLKNKGNLKSVQLALNMSYPTAKKKLSELLRALSIDDDDAEPEELEVIDVNLWQIDKNSGKASEIVKNKLKECGGRAVIHSISGNPIEIWACPDGKTFGCDKLPVAVNYEYSIFDVVADSLAALGGKARKGNGRNYKVGDPECNEETVAGIIGMKYFGKVSGESTLDPVFAIAAILDWADIASNERGYVTLKASYLSRS